MVEWDAFRVSPDQLFPCFYTVNDDGFPQLLRQLYVFLEYRDLDLKGRA